MIMIQKSVVYKCWIYLVFIYLEIKLIVFFTAFLEVEDTEKK